MTRRTVDANRVRAFLEALSRAASGEVTVYLVGGATAVTEGWRPTTLDIDLRVDAGHLRAAVTDLVHLHDRGDDV